MANILQVKVKFCKKVLTKHKKCDIIIVPKGKRDKKMNLTDLTTLSNSELEILIKEARNCLNKRAEAWGKLKEALQEYLKYDTIVMHKDFLEEEVEICITDFQDLFINEEGLIYIKNEERLF